MPKFSSDNTFYGPMVSNLSFNLIQHYVDPLCPNFLYVTGNPLCQFSLFNTILHGPLMPKFSLDNTFYGPMVSNLSFNLIQYYVDPLCPNFL